MSHAFSARVRVAPDVMFRLVGDEGVLVNLNTERYLGLNAVGARMWTALGNSGSIEVEPARLRADLDEFVDRLLGQQLIETDAGGESPRQG